MIQSSCGVMFKSTSRVRNPHKDVKQGICTASDVIRNSRVASELFAETCFEPTKTDLNIVARSGGDARMSPIETGLAGVLHMAVDGSLSLALRPDDVMLAIVVQVSAYLTPRFTRPGFARPSEMFRITTTQDSTPEDMEKSLMQGLVRTVDNAVYRAGVDKGFTPWVMTPFTTTTPTDTVCRLSAVLGTQRTMSKVSVVGKGCGGMPSTTLLGSSGDWARLRVALNDIVRFDAGDLRLSGWCSKLTPVVDEMYRVVQGEEPNLRLWNKVYFSNMHKKHMGWFSVFTTFAPDGSSHATEAMEGEPPEKVTVVAECIGGVCAIPGMVDEVSCHLMSGLCAYSGGGAATPETHWCLGRTPPLVIKLKSF